MLDKDLKSISIGTLLKNLNKDTYHFVTRVVNGKVFIEPPLFLEGENILVPAIVPYISNSKDIEWLIYNVNDSVADIANFQLLFEIAETLY